MAVAAMTHLGSAAYDYALGSPSLVTRIVKTTMLVAAGAFLGLAAYSAYAGLELACTLTHLAGGLALLTLAWFFAGKPISNAGLASSPSSISEHPEKSLRGHRRKKVSHAPDTESRSKHHKSKRSTSSSNPVLAILNPSTEVAAPLEERH